MLATSRVKRTRPPLAEMSMLLVDVGAVEQQRVGAGLALDGVAAVAGVPDWKVSSPAPSRAVSLPRLPSMKSLPSPPSSMSSPSPPVIVSLPAPPSTRELDQRGQAVAGRERVVAAVGVDDQVLGGADVDGERGRGRRGRSAPACRWR